MLNTFWETISRIQRAIRNQINGEFSLSLIRIRYFEPHWKGGQLMCLICILLSNSEKCAYEIRLKFFFYFLCFFFYTKVNGTLWTLNCFRKCETLSSLRTMQTRQCLLSFNSETKKKLIAFDLHYRKNKSRV